MPTSSSVVLNWDEVCGPRPRGLHATLLVRGSFVLPKGYRHLPLVQNPLVQDAKKELRVAVACLLMTERNKACHLVRRTG